MIKISKLEEPEVLKNNKDSWTLQFLTLHSSGETIPNGLKNKYKHHQIKGKIMVETHNKCAYCESRIPHVSFGDIEHISPKSYRPDLIFEWSNLTYSCEQCNRTRKRDYYNPEDPLINPYEDDPRDHLTAHGPFISHRIGDRKGELTQKILELNRTDLLAKRLEKIQTIEMLVDKWASEDNPEYKKILEQELWKEAGDDAEYAFIVREYLFRQGIR